MLNKTIVLGLAMLMTLAGIAPSGASLRYDVSALRPTIAAGGNWLLPMAEARTETASLDPTVPSIAQPAIRGGDYGLFGSVALPISALPATKQWLRVSATDFTAQYGARCVTTACTTGVGGRLRQAALLAKGKPALEAMGIITRSVNTLIRYRSDKADIWSTPVETAARGAGDCEDYAIAKMWLLRSIGYSADQLQLVVLKNTRSNAYHAVLAVHVDGKRYILDNLSSKVLPDAALTAYVPIQSFSGNSSFIHGFAKKPIQTASTD